MVKSLAGALNIAEHICTSGLESGDSMHRHHTYVPISGVGKAVEEPMVVCPFCIERW